MASLLTETTLVGQNKMYLKRQAQQTRAYSCIFVLSLRRCLAVFGHVLSSVWWVLVDFAPSFHVFKLILMAAAHAGDFAFGSGSATKISGLS